MSDLMEEFRRICDRLRDSGHNVVAVVSSYDKDGAHFSTRLSVKSDVSQDLTEDHVVLDSLREIMTEWHRSRHSN